MTDINIDELINNIGDRINHPKNVKLTKKIKSELVKILSKKNITKNKKQCI